MCALDFMRRFARSVRSSSANLILFPLFIKTFTFVKCGLLSSILYAKPTFCIGFPGTNRHTLIVFDMRFFFISSLATLRVADSHNIWFLDWLGNRFFMDFGSILRSILAPNIHKNMINLGIYF